MAPGSGRPSMADAGRDAGPELPLPETVGVLMPLASWLPGLGGGAGGVGVGPGTSAAKLAIAAVWKGLVLESRMLSLAPATCAIVCSCH